MTKMEIGRTLSGIAAVVLLLLFAVSADTQTQRAFTTDNGLAGDSVASWVETGTIPFIIQEATSVTLKIYDIDGRLQETLASGMMYVGRNAVL